MKRMWQKLNFVFMIKEAIKIATATYNQNTEHMHSLILHM